MALGLWGPGCVESAFRWWDSPKNQLSKTCTPVAIWAFFPLVCFSTALQVSERKLRPMPQKERTLHEKILEEIKQERKLRPVDQQKQKGKWESFSIRELDSSYPGKWALGTSKCSVNQRASDSSWL